MSNLQKNLFKDEKALMEKVYKEFDKRIGDAEKNVRYHSKTVDKGGYDYHEEFIVKGHLGEAERNLNKIDRLVGKLYNKPYFSHVRVKDTGEGDEENYFLSDCPSLDEVVFIDDGHNGYIVPFKQDKNRPISYALFHCYQARDGKNVSYITNNKMKCSLTPKLICDTDIESRVLKNVIQCYPKPKVEETRVTADEMLESKLNENRNDPNLRNIISTLQLRQFEIIGTEIDESFVLQGCAGSGKSQCLIHRLFFFRASLSEDGWDKVLLITPTKLFRQYSNSLMKRYQLTNINNCSIADLYLSLLKVYDSRFRDRQYTVEMTEEYLPDGYLQTVYDEDNIQMIETEIDNAIISYVRKGCEVLGIDIPAAINSDVINEMVEKLDAEIEAYDKREESLKNNQEYQNKRKDYEQSIRDLEAAEKRLTKYKNDLQNNVDKKEILFKALQALESINTEKNEWKDNKAKRISDAYKELEKIGKEFDKGTDLSAPANYARQLFHIRELTQGKIYVVDQMEQAYFDEMIKEAQNNIQELTKEKNPQKAVDRYVKREKEIQESIDFTNLEIEELSNKIEEYGEWIRKVSYENDEKSSKASLQRSEMQQSRYCLSRIESTIFEREVWNALTPIKNHFNIETLEITELKGDKHKENRILYKADLLYYILIYMKLHPDTVLPEYNLICIDEGQDLHRADYGILKALYPNAVFNIFGDIDQVLHTECGINNWKEDTGIKTIYRLTTNYRNTAAIVDFCNKKFDIGMEYIGNVDKYQKPDVIKDIKSAKEIVLKNDVVTIVKDKKAFEELCNELKVDSSFFHYLDTNSDRPETKVRECYSIFAAKGLEFPRVFVYAKNMSKNQKVVACTRAMGGLYYYE